MLFDADAFREALVNAFVHNRWVDGNAPMITVFSARIEIFSRGTLPPGQTVEGFFAGESVPVSRALSDIFLQLHISERTGRGVPRITGVYGRGTCSFDENSIVVTIPFDRLGGSGEMPGKVGNPQASPQAFPQGTPQAFPQAFPQGTDAIAERILQCCSTPKGTVEICEELGYKDRKTIRKRIQALLDEGRLAMTIPESPRNMHQKYVAIR